MFGGIETGGTKTVCAIGRDGRIVDRQQFPTGDDPSALAEHCAAFFAERPLTAVGVGTFGPCDPDPDSAMYGHILSTPKPGWAGADLLGLLSAGIHAPFRFTTDVNAAAVGEHRYGAGVGATTLVYLTIGTGVGGGAIVDGHLLHGNPHPEMGHMLLAGSQPHGICPYHAGCLEGLASGPAMRARAGRPAQDIPDDDPQWDVEAELVAIGLHNIVCALAPQRIIIGGGVGSRSALHRRLPGLLAASLAGYMPVPSILTPALGADAGVIGAMTWAQDHSQG